MGSVSLLQHTNISSQPVSSLDWSPDKQGLAVCTAFDQCLRVIITTKLNTYWSVSQFCIERIKTLLSKNTDVLFAPIIAPARYSVFVGTLLGRLVPRSAASGARSSSINLKMAGVLFEDIFNVKDIDPEGKKFDRGEYDRHRTFSYTRKRIRCWNNRDRASTQKPLDFAAIASFLVAGNGLLSSLPESTWHDS